MAMSESAVQKLIDERMKLQATEIAKQFDNLKEFLAAQPNASQESERAAKAAARLVELESQHLSKRDQIDEEIRQIRDKSWKGPLAFIDKPVVVNIENNTPPLLTRKIVKRTR